VVFEGRASNPVLNSDLRSKQVYLSRLKLRDIRDSFVVYQWEGSPQIKKVQFSLDSSLTNNPPQIPLMEKHHLRFKHLSNFKELVCTQVEFKRNGIKSPRVLKRVEYSALSTLEPFDIRS
jgi:hypothetical protein